MRLESKGQFEVRRAGSHVFQCKIEFKGGFLLNFFLIRALLEVGKCIFVNAWEFQWENDQNK